MEFCFRVAMATFGVNARFLTTKEFCKDFLTDDLPDYFVTLTAEDCKAERNRYEAFCRKNGEIPKDFTDSYFETLALYRKVTEILADHDTLLFHGSALSFDGNGIVFTAPSGTGKSTHTRFWRERFGTHVVMINDDKPLIRLLNGKFFVCGTPWNGKHRIGNNLCVPLKAICLLNRGTKNTITPISATAAWQTVFSQTYTPANRVKTESILLLIDRLVTSVCLYRLECLPEMNAAEVACREIVENEGEYTQ